MLPNVRWIATLTLFLTVCAAPTRAADDPPYCDQAAADVAQRIGAPTPQRVEKSHSYTLGKKGDVELRLRCPTGSQRQPRIVMSWKATYPPRAFWSVVADVGAKLTGASHRRVRLSAHKCHKASLLAADGHAVRRSRGLGIECHTTTGSNGISSVALRRRQDFRL